MAYFEFPHTRNYDGDLGWVIKKIIELTDRYNDFFEYNSITFADPLQWDITKQYPPYQIVFDYDQGYSYISKRPVPAGVTITNPDYWCLVGPLIVDAYARSEIQTILEFVANIYESGAIASAVRSVGEYVVANGQLYKVTAPINIGEGYTEGINVTKWTIEDMINDRFPVVTADIDDLAVTNDKLAANSVSMSKIRDHVINKSKMVEDKYLFIGDSYNAPYHHGGWASFIANHLGLVLGTNYWSVNAPGGGMADHEIYDAVVAEAANITLADKLAITKIVVCAGLNDWAAANTDIMDGVKLLENYLTTTFPNADITLVCGEWAYSQPTIREGTLNAYNMYVMASKKMRVVTNAFILFLDPYFLETDMTHPTADGMYNLARSIENILMGGTAWNKFYATLQAQINPTSYGGDHIIAVQGDISEAGTHVYRNAWDGIVFSSGIQITHAGTQIGVIDTVNNLFQRDAIIPCESMIQYNENGVTKYGILHGRLRITKDANLHQWNVFLLSDTIINGTYDVTVTNLHLDFDCMLGYTHT